MSTIVQVLLDAELVESLKQITAEGDKRSMTDLLNDIVKEYIARRHDEQISAEAARFRERHSQIWAQYPGQYIAMRDGKVLDHDVDLTALHQIENRVTPSYSRALFQGRPRTNLWPFHSRMPMMSG